MPPRKTQPRQLLAFFSILSLAVSPVVAADETELWDHPSPSSGDVQKVLDGIPNLRRADHHHVESQPAPENSGKQIAARSIPYPAIAPHTPPGSATHPRADQSSPHADGHPSQPLHSSVSGAATHSPAAGAAGSTAAGGLTLKGGVTFCVPRGTPFKLKLATIPMPSLKQELRDEEGNLRPAQLNEVITARTTEDIYIDDNKVIPEGTEFHGKVANILPPRRVGRPGHLELKFDSFKTPDGRRFAFKAEANNFKPSTTKSKLKGLGRIAAHGAGGAALGALISYKVFGLEKTIAMDGYNIAGGAALGAAGGIAYALWSRGKEAVLEPGDEFQMSIDGDMLVPAATTPTPKRPPVNLPGLSFESMGTKIIKDGLGGRILRVDGYITNHTHKRLNSIDLFVEDELGSKFPVTPDLVDDSETLFYIEPLSCSRMKCAFQTQFPKLKHKMIWYEHETKRVLLEQKL